MAEQKHRENGVMMQYFEWYLPPHCGLWNQLKKEAPILAEKGITALWLPPAYKGLKGDEEVGYAVYDLYDLGEFNQKGSVATKYGTKEEYLAAVDACHKAGISVYTDIVLNQMVEGDELETVRVTEYDPHDRNTPLPDEKWLRMYRDLGGEIITLGTDAHSPQFVGCAIRERQQLLKDCGFTRFCTFEKMRPIWHDL